jgi:hypothetical protein
MNIKAPRAWYKPLGVMIQPEKVESINFETKVVGVYLEMDGRGFHRLRLSDFELMFYAGFHDDSDDPVEVFQGDVVQFEYEGEGHTCEVKYEGSGFMFVADSLPDGYLWASELIEFDGSYCWAEGVMVVGNVNADRGLAPKEGAEQ